MITDEEERFFNYWKENRLRENSLRRQLFSGLPWGLSLGAAIIICLNTGWYQRAEMEASTELNPYVLLIAIVLIAIFTGLFYKKHKWDINEQRYKEILYKKTHDK